MNISQLYILISICVLAIITVMLILLKRKKLKPLLDDTPRNSKFMFFTGITFVVVSAALLLGNFMGESTFPTMLGAMGVIFIGASGFRLLRIK